MLQDLDGNETLTVTEIPAAGEHSFSLSSSDQSAQVKARILAFAAVKGLPFSSVPDLLDLCKGVAENKKALMKTNMSRQCATYTLSGGLAAAFKAELRSKLLKTPFSLNVDEATNNAMDKVVNIIVRYYDEDRDSVQTAFCFTCGEPCHGNKHL
jgi:hypothetical protein